jgi:hypothetical protein
MKHIFILITTFALSFQSLADEAPSLPNLNEIGKKAYNEAYKSPRCSFEYFVSDKDKGSLLALDARLECAANAAFKAIGKQDSVSHEAYNLWKDNQLLVILEKIFKK